MGIGLIIIVVLAIGLHEHYDFLRSQISSVSPVYFSLSLFFLVVDYLVVPSLWCKILATFGITLSYRRAFCIQYISHLGRYIPGKIWSYVMQSSLTAQDKISPTQTLGSSVILTLLMNVGGLVVFATSFLLWDIVTVVTRVALVVSFFLLIGILCRLHVLEKTLNLIATKFATHYPPMHCTPLPYLSLTALTLSSWLAFTVGLHMIVNSFYRVDIRQSVILVGIFAVSWLLGYYALLSPGGLGVQEGIQVYLLTFFFPLPLSIVIALALRLWITLGDIIVFVWAMVLTLTENRLQRSAHE